MSSFYDQILFNRPKDQLPMQMQWKSHIVQMLQLIRDISTVQGAQFERRFSDEGTKIQRKRSKIAKQGVRFAPLQKLGTLAIRFPRAFSEEELRNHLSPFWIQCDAWK